ncbi:unnamed protein product [Closterium sp. Naga37s-1]|nr:unnamed protein product [Closterium sp. Naga37s-1]
MRAAWSDVPGPMIATGRCCTVAMAAGAEGEEREGEEGGKNRRVRVRTCQLAEHGRRAGADVAGDQADALTWQDGGVVVDVSNCHGDCWTGGMGERGEDGGQAKGDRVSNCHGDCWTGGTGGRVGGDKGQARGKGEKSGDGGYAGGDGG